MRKLIVFFAILIMLSVWIFVLIDRNRNISDLNSLNSDNKQLGPPSVSTGKVPEINFSLPDEFVVHTFAENMGNARDMVFTPQGTLLVSDTTSNRVYALPDRNGDGVADENKIIISNERNVHGLAIYNDKIYIADVDKVVRYNWDENSLTASQDKVLFNLPENGNHDNRTIVFDNNGKMYISLGSNCNVCIQDPTQGGSVLVSDANGKTPKVFARGLRNAAFLTINPATNQVWSTEMGRDHLGDDTPPDEINIVTEGNNYGWPNCYGNKIWDRDFNKSKSNPCQNTTTPIFEIPAHSAPLGLVFIDSDQFPDDWQNDLLVAYHGSWNRSTPAGFKIVHLDINGDSITSSDDFMTGFQEGENAKSAYARPVDLIFDKKGNLYVSDDKGGNIFIIQKVD